MEIIIELTNIYIFRDYHDGSDGSQRSELKGPEMIWKQFRF